MENLTSGRNHEKIARIPAGAIWMPSGALKEVVLSRRPVAIVIPAESVLVRY
jgi:hypothetical protein